MPEGVVSGAAHLACIIGWPVSKSLSPVIHQAAFEAAGLDWAYIAIPVRPGAVGEGVGLLRTLGVDGANVTMPHKEVIREYLDSIDEEAAAIGAVNTVVRDGELLIGHNTDGIGFVRFLEHDANFDPRDKAALILGAGGAARAVVRALTGAGARVTVSARRPERAASVAGVAEEVATAEWGAAVSADLVVNATPVRDGLPVQFGPEMLAVDMIYQPPETSFVSEARSAGARAFDGLGMLVHQAALSFTLWTGVEAPVQIMREAAETAMRRG